MRKKSRLAMLPPRLATMPQRLERSRIERERDRLAARDEEVTWRAWYKTQRWQKLRQAALIRDMWTCRQTGILVTGKYPADDSAVVDHIIPHRGDPALFWDLSNLQVVSKAFHDSTKQSLERSRQP